MKMKAAVLYETGKPFPYQKSRPLVVEDVDLEGPGEGEVLVKIVAAGLCHSDLSVISGARAKPTPLLPGHEAAGIVRELGKGVTRFKVDDHVVMVFASSCGRCRYCAEGRGNLCEVSWRSRAAGALSTGGRRLTAHGVRLNHNSGISCFAEYAVVSETSLVSIPKEVSLNDAAVFGCAVITGVGAVANTAHVRFGATVAVIGLGGVGLSAILGANAAGASKIIAVDLNEKKLSLAKSVGATHTFNASSKDLAAMVKDVTGGGVDYAFEMAGAPAATEAAFSILRRGGELVISGLPSATQSFALPVSLLVSNEYVIAGSYMGSCVATRDIPAYIELYREGRLPVDRLRSGTVSLETLNEGFDRLARSESVRDILIF